MYRKGGREAFGLKTGLGGRGDVPPTKTGTKIGLWERGAIGKGIVHASFRLRLEGGDGEGTPHVVAIWSIKNRNGGTVEPRGEMWGRGCGGGGAVGRGAGT